METKNTNKRTLTGLLILLIGTALLLNNFDWVQFPVKHYIFSWKTLLIGIGILIMATKENYSTGVFLMGLGFIFWMPEIFDNRFALRDIFWPALLILLGIVLLLKAAVPCKKDSLRYKKDEICEAEIISYSETGGAPKQD